MYSSYQRWVSFRLVWHPSPLSSLRPTRTSSASRSWRHQPSRPPTWSRRSWRWPPRSRAGWARRPPQSRPAPAVPVWIYRAPRWPTAREAAAELTPRVSIGGRGMAGWVSVWCFWRWVWLRLFWLVCWTRTRWYIECTVVRLGCMCCLSFRLIVFNYIINLVKKLPQSSGASPRIFEWGKGNESFGGVAILLTK